MIGNFDRIQGTEYNVVQSFVLRTSGWISILKSKIVNPCS